MSNYLIKSRNLSRNPRYTDQQLNIMRARRRPVQRDVARDVARDMYFDQASPNSGNRLTRESAALQFGWLGAAISDMGNTARYALSLNKDNSIIIANGYPLQTLSNSPAGLVNACAIAVAGAAGKTYSSAFWPAVPAAVSLALTANTTNAFGALVKISASTLNFTYGTYEVQFAIGAAVISSILLQVTSLPATVVILGISNNAGRGSIIGNATPTVIFPYSAVAGAVGNVNAGAMTSTMSLYAETLNMRDIGVIIDAVQQGAILL